MAKRKVYEVGDRVFAKVRGFPAWPARIAGVAGGANTKYHVFFYGTYETGTIKKDEIWEYNEQTKARFGKGNAKRKGFNDGMYEIENHPDIAVGQPHEPEPVPAATTSKTSEVTTEKEATEATTDVPGEAAKTTEENESRDSAAAEEGGGEEKAASEVEAPETEKETPEERTAAESSGGGTEKKNEGEDEADENALVINEDANKTKVTPRPSRGAKRKAEEANSSAPAKKKKASASANVTPATPSTPATTAAATPASSETPATTTTTTTATVSRSGRVIKPKKFVDDDDDKADGTNEAPPPPPPPPPKSTPKPKPAKEPRKMWVEVKSTGDMIEINLDQDKPASFESKEAELHWEKATARSALKFKERVESGEFIPDEVRIKLEEKINRTEEEEEILRKARLISVRMEKIRWLKIEQRLVDIVIAMKTALHIEKPDIDKCLESLGELDTMAVAPLMLKKQPDIVTTIRRLRRYVGPSASTNTTEDISAKAEKIRTKADQIYAKIQSIFSVPEGEPFDEIFEGEVNNFRNAIKSMDSAQVLALVSDPTKKPSNLKRRTK